MATTKSHKEANLCFCHHMHAFFFPHSVSFFRERAPVDPALDSLFKARTQDSTNQQQKCPLLSEQPKRYVYVI